MGTRQPSASSPVVAIIKRLFHLTDDQVAALLPNGPDAPAGLFGGIIDFDANEEGQREKHARENAAEGWHETR